MANFTRCILSATAAGVLAAQSLEAQVPAPPDTARPPTQPTQLLPPQQPRTHTVVRGDNLWDLSQRYLGNPFLWPEIYRLNRDVVEDPHWIFPGEVLRLPGPEPEVAEVPTPGVPTPPTPTPEGPLEATVFTKVQPPLDIRVTRGADINIEDRPTVRAGEVIAAPYVDREGGPRGFGRILKSGDIPGVAGASDRSRFQAYDRIFIAPPVGYVAPEGERYISYRLGPILDEQGQIIIPTGIIEVVKAAGSSVAAVAKVVKAFGAVTLDDRLIPIDTAGTGTRVRPEPVINGPSTKIRWVYGEPVLPSVQSFVVLDVSAQQGVRMGDEFVIYLPRQKQERGQLDDPEILIGKAQVVRSTPFGVTAVVIGQAQPAIKEGMDARVAARMP